jgi:hypothetical protein
MIYCTLRPAAVGVLEVRLPSEAWAAQGHLVGRLARHIACAHVYVQVQELQAALVGLISEAAVKSSH